MTTAEATVARPYRQHGQLDTNLCIPACTDHLFDAIFSAGDRLTHVTYKACSRRQV